MDSTFIFVTWIGFTFIGGLAIFILDHFFFFRNFYKPNGELIFNKINEDEAKVSVKLYEDRLDDTIKSEKVVFKVTRE